MKIQYLIGNSKIIDFVIQGSDFIIPDQIKKLIINDMNNSAFILPENQK